MQEFFALRDLSYEKKLRTLLQCEPDLLDRKQRLKKPCLRMKGITQSYFLYDSVMYKPLRPILLELRQSLDASSVEKLGLDKKYNPGAE